MKKILAIIILVSGCSLLFAETELSLDVTGNEDGTVSISVKGGENAAKVKVYLIENTSGERISEAEFDDTGTVNLEIPSVPYTVVLEDAEGNRLEKDGPEPPGGFPEGEGDGTGGDEIQEEEPEEETTEGPDVNPALVWTKADTSAMPNVGPSFTAILALALSIINLCLIIFLLIKKYKR
ncbi:hypothetical protein [Treponema pedis]|uniref:hypothetical protein n=1 Tax=Treponema pedis TaxID=409322 RepID=UPI0003F7D2CF|nr:hypothetical protein [Treponema pedis]